jgi:hypothetical protein
LLDFEEIEEAIVIVNGEKLTVETRKMGDGSSPFHLR